jgi:hypothetical protein
MLRRFCLLATLATGLLAGCDMLGIESPERIAALKEADGKAVGGGCRHAGRAIEDCYVLNRKVEKAAIFAGWREMNDYMRENKIESVAPQLTAVPAAVVAKSDVAAPARDETQSAPKAPAPKPAKEAKSRDS